MENPINRACVVFIIRVDRGFARLPGIVTHCRMENPDDAVAAVMYTVAFMNVMHDSDDRVLIEIQVR